MLQALKHRPADKGGGQVQGTKDVSLLAELGILLLLFIAGMEVDLKNFKDVARISLRPAVPR